MKMEVEIVESSGDTTWCNPVEQIIISVKDGYDYEFAPEDIKSIKIYPMENQL